MAAGGTGGHIYPALAIASEIKRMSEETDILFVGTEGKIEEKIIPDSGYELKKIKISGFKRKIDLSNIKVLFQFSKAVSDSKKILNDFKPNVVFGTGGYVSGPVLWSAARMRYPTVILEGNYYPGLTVKWLAPKMDKVILNFSDTQKYLKRKDNIEIMPYPVRTFDERTERTKALDFFNLSDKKTIFVFGGSQGAGSINNTLLKLYKGLFEKGIQIIWQTGDKDFSKIYNEAGSLNGIKILKYIDRIEFAYSAADLVVCRAGISSVMEAAKFGLAVIFVPYPLASENHQQRNAEALYKSNSAEMLLDSELEMKLFSKIVELIDNKERLMMLRENIQKYSVKDAARNIAAMFFELGNSEKSDGKQNL